MKVRQYVADGQGAVKIQTVPDYPQELSSTQLSHTVGNLSKALVFYESFITIFISWPGPEVPYDVQLVASNGAGCGKVTNSKYIFTREGGKICF